MTECLNPGCPIGCPDSHAVVYEPADFSCGTFRDPTPSRDEMQRWSARAMRLAAERAGRTPWSWASLPGLSIAYDGSIYGRGPSGGQWSGPSDRWREFVIRGSWLTTERREKRR